MDQLIKPDYKQYLVNILRKHRFPTMFSHFVIDFHFQQDQRQIPENHVSTSNLISSPQIQGFIGSESPGRELIKHFKFTVTWKPMVEVGLLFTATPSQIITV